MVVNHKSWTRRDYLKAGLLASAGWWAVPGAWAAELTATPALTEGPFYPDKLPLDTDNDLIIVNNSVTPAVGALTHLTGAITGPTGAPVRNAFVEIWQVDHHGAYLHSGTSNRDRRDGHFQGYGRFLTDAQGRYYFRTVKPVAYPGRTPHIHVAVSQNGRRILTTQLLIRGEAQNARDGVFKAITDPKLRELLLVDFNPVAESKLGELTANFNIVLGKTPVDAPEAINGGIGAREGNRRPG